MLHVKTFPALQDYTDIWERMKTFTDKRTKETPDELWVLQHYPVYTQGQNGKPEYLLNTNQIPVVHSDRGGQITYHGPGQLIIYLLIDLERLQWTVRDLVSLCEKAVIATLADQGIIANARSDAPGVYVDGAKIASVGLRVRRGCSYHGLAFNLNMDMRPFEGIVPCGLNGIRMIQLEDLLREINTDAVTACLIEHIQQALQGN